MNNRAEKIAIRTHLRRIKRHVGRKLYDARVKKNKTLKQVAGRTGVDAVVFDRIELGHGEMSWHAIITVTRYYGVSFSGLFKDG